MSAQVLDCKVVAQSIKDDCKAAAESPRSWVLYVLVKKDRTFPTRRVLPKQ